MVPIGKAKVVREGKHITLISHSRMVELCKEAASELAKKGIEVEVIDLRTIKPLDIATIADSVRKTHLCALVEEGHVFAGICAEVGFLIQEHCFDYPRCSYRARMPERNPDALFKSARKRDHANKRADHRRTQ